MAARRLSRNNSVVESRIARLGSDAASDRSRLSSPAARFVLLAFAIGALLAFGTLVATPRLAAQDAAEPPASGGGEMTIKSNVNNSVIHQHRVGAWSVLGVNSSNHGDEESEGLISAFFADEPFRQYARRVWVPPRARRSTWLPIRLPTTIPGGKGHVALSVIQLDPTSKREVFQRSEGDPLKSDPLLGLSQDPIRSASYVRRNRSYDSRVNADPDLDALETLMTARKFVGLPPQSNDFTDDFLPPWGESLESIDQLLLTSDQIRHDEAGLTAIRSWVRDGGKLWLALDRLEMDTVRAILGNAVNFDIVDRVAVDKFTLESSEVLGKTTVRDEGDYEVPVDFVRVVTTSNDVPVRLDGWPAAIWVPLGEGDVLVTLLGPRGWRPGADRQPTEALKVVASRLLSGRDGKGDPQAMQAALQQKIGYQIPQRSFGVAILGGYCAALLVGGILLFRRGQADRLIWLVPAVTLLAAGVLFGAGAANSTSVPPTIAMGQLIQVGVETDEVQIHGLAAVYDQRNREIAWQATERGWAIPETKDGAEVRRQIWTHSDRTETQNASTRAGSVGIVHIDEVRSLAQPLAVRARFGPRGLEGRVLGDRTGWSEPVIVAPPSPSLAIEMSSDGRFVGGPDDALPADQFTSNTLLNDDERRRQDVLRQLFNTADTISFPHRPSLVAWRPALESGVQAPAEFRQDGEALALIPLEMERTPPATEFRIPASFLRANSAVGAQGQSLAFNSRTGQWVQKLTTPSDTVLAFQLPAQVLPCELARGKLTVRLSAPGREFKVTSVRGAERAVVQSIADPIGVYDVELTSEHLQPDAQGRVVLGLSIGPTDAQAGVGAGGSRSSTSNTWQIDYVRLTVDGKTRPEDAQP